jgi:exopolysaccharide biosynthesis protein
MHSMLPSGFSMSPVCTEILSTLHYKQSHKAITEYFHSDMHFHKLFGAKKMCIPCNDAYHQKTRRIPKAVSDAQISTTQTFT